MQPVTSLELNIKSLEQTELLGKVLAECLSKMPKKPAILYLGCLGAGKTTLTRSLIKNLPGGNKAEVNSPSFNIINLYPTTPEAAHFDLYRLQGMSLDPDLEDCLLDPEMIVLVEWSEYLPLESMPDDFVQIHFSVQNSLRILKLTPSGSLAKKMLTGLKTALDRTTWPAGVTLGSESV